MTDEIQKVYWTTGEVAKMFGCSTTWIWVLSNRIGVHRGRNQRHKFDKTEIAAMKSMMKPRNLQLSQQQLSGKI